MEAETTPPRRNVPAPIVQVIVEAWRANVSLSLGREETAFLAGIYAYFQDDPKPSIDDDKLREIFAPVFELAQPGTDSENQRATMMIGRLKSQGILLRNDLGGVSSEGEYTLSQLGLALGRSMEKERELNKRNLSFMLMHMRAVLVNVLHAAARADDENGWESQVIFPMRDLIIELIRLVDQRQRALDEAHRALRKEVSELMDSEWSRAVDRCVAMIRQVDETLRELNEVLSEHVEHLERQLLDLMAYTTRHPDLPMLVDRSRSQLQRLHSWSELRYEEWHGYYRNVQIFIRDVVRTDPNNLLRTRITEQIRRFCHRPYGLVTASPPAFLHLRDIIRPALSAPLAVPVELLSEGTLAEFTEVPPDRVAMAVAALVERIRVERRIDLLDAVRELDLDFTEEEFFELLQRATPVLLEHGISVMRILNQAWEVLSVHLHAQSLALQLRSTRTSQTATPSTHTDDPPDEKPMP